MGHTPCALFVTVSDIDRNLDPLTGLFISQAFMGLIREADRQPDGSLPVPVRFMLDDFANLQIPQIDNVLSIIRSRNIWATLLLQSTNQLDALYGEARARSIMGNCDTHLVLAFRDPESAGVFPTAPTRCPARSWRRRSIARGSLYAVALPNRSSALGSKTTRSTGSCPRRSETMRRPRSRRRVLAARGARRCSTKAVRPGTTAKQRGPHPMGYGPLTIRRDALTAATTYGERGRTSMSARVEASCSALAASSWKAGVICLASCLPSSTPHWS